MGAAERGELTEADGGEEAGRGEGADRDSEEISGGTFPKCRMTLPITTCREVERVSSCTISPQLACRAITTGTYTSHPTPSLNTTTIIILQFREISQQSCESSLRVIGLFCIWSLGLWEAHGAQGDEWTEQNYLISQWGQGISGTSSPFFSLIRHQEYFLVHSYGWMLRFKDSGWKNVLLLSNMNETRWMPHVLLKPLK